MQDFNLQRREVEASIEKYTQAFDLSPEDHIITRYGRINLTVIYGFLLSNRSHAFMKINKFSEAVRDAKYTVAMRPDWGKGYFRLGRALSGLGDPEEALLAFFHCLVLEETCSKALRAEIVRVSFFCNWYYRYIMICVLWQELSKILSKDQSRMELDTIDSRSGSQVRSDKERQKTCLHYCCLVARRWSAWR